MRNIGNIRVQPRRNFVLWILAIFAMINAGSNGMTDLIFALMPKVAAQSIEALKALPLFSSSEYTEAFGLMLSIKNWQYGLLFLTEAAGFAGAFLMLVKLNSTGFHIYTIGQICQVLIMNFVIGGKLSMDLTDILMVILIVAMFATQLPFMKNGSDDEEIAESQDSTEDPGSSEQDVEDPEQNGKEA